MAADAGKAVTLTGNNQAGPATDGSVLLGKLIDLTLTDAEEGKRVATVQIGGRMVHTAADGDGPVEALDRALRRALRQDYPEVADLHLTDYKVRVLDATEGSSAAVRVLIQTANGGRTWGTVGANENIIEASWQALTDSIVYGLFDKAQRNEVPDTSE